MDGLKSKLDLIEENRTVIVLGTTSKKSLIDPAMLRPGRLDLHINIPLPNHSNRLKFIEKSYLLAHISCLKQILQQF